MSPTRWELRCVELGRPPCLNAERSGHWTARAELTKEWRQAFYLLAREAGLPRRLPAIRVASFPSYPDRRSWPDLGGWLPATKAAVDGLVDAGVIADDDPEHLVELSFWPPRLASGPPGLTLLVEAA